MLEIARSDMEVTSVNLRKESHGDELKLAMDVAVLVTVLKKGLTVADEIAPSIARAMWNSEGNAETQGIIIGLDHKVENCWVEIAWPVGDAVVIFPEANLKGINLEPMGDFGLLLTCKVQALANDGDAAPLWRMLRMPGAKIVIVENQIQVPDAD